MINEIQIERIYQFLDTYASNFPLSGNFLISQRQQPLITAAFGLADRSFQVKNTIHTRFPIASISKAFTCMAILLLHQEKKLDIHAAVNKYLPGFAKTDGRVRLHHLMSHSSGLPDYRISKGQKLSEVFSAPISCEEWVRRFLSFEPLFEPGSQFAYSNPGYYLLGMVVEEVSGMAFEDFLKKNIFSPLGMEHSGVDDPVKVIPSLARGYDFEKGTYVQAPYTDARNFYPQGGLFSNAGDLAIWLKALQTHALLSPELQQEMFVPRIPAGSRHHNHYAYGWHILNIEGRLVYGHGGFHWGFRSHIEHFPEEDTSIILLSNNGFQDLMKISKPVLDFLHGKELKLPKKPAPEKVDNESYLGSYRSGDFEIRLWMEGNKYWMKWGQSPAHEVYPTGAGSFHHAFIDEAYRVRITEDGKMFLAGCEKVQD